MSSENREYRMRFAELGANEMEGNVAFTLTLDAPMPLRAVPIVTGSIPELLRGRTVMRPFRVEGIDANGALTAAYAVNGRWAGVGRLVDLQHRATSGGYVPGGGWRTYGTGRCTGLGEMDGPGKFHAEVSDESWKSRIRSDVWGPANTTRIWPAGIQRAVPILDFGDPLWRGIYGAEVNSGFRVEQSGDLYRIRVEANYDRATESTSHRGYRVTDRMVEWISKDLRDDWALPVRVQAGVITGNFEHLRLNYNFVDYEITSFGPSDSQGVGPFGPMILQTLQDPDIREGSIDITISMHLWIIRLPGQPEPPAGGLSTPAWLHAPTAPPDDAMKLHVGLAEPAHPWGTTAGYIHVATLTRRLWTRLGQRFSESNLAELEQDLSFPALAPRMGADAHEDPETIMARKAWGPCVLVALRDIEGRRKLVDLRPPLELDVSGLPVLNADTTRENTWQLLPTETINSIEWRYLDLWAKRMLMGSSGSATRRLAHRRQELDDSQYDLDYVVATEKGLDPIQGDTVDVQGERPHTIDLGWALEPTARDERLSQMLAQQQGDSYANHVARVTPGLLAMNQDGPERGYVEIEGSLADTLEEGSLAMIDHDSLQSANPVTAARTGQRLVRIVSLGRAPDHGPCEYITVPFVPAPPVFEEDLCPEPE